MRWTEGSFLQGATFIDGNKIVVGLTARGKDAEAASVCEFAIGMGIAPGIVVGRLQNEGCIKYNMMNELKAHYEIAV